MTYLILARTNTGEVMEKVCMECSIEDAIKSCRNIMATSKKITRGEIVEGNRQWIGDFTVKPIYRLEKIDEAYEVTDCADIFKKLTL
jgi:hypothetical protein